ncbi:MAG: nucleoside transporter, partial [Candidatus Omnitrophica bacterium]|nr:nucleoside transporter [Candidatus Omnitrophota bacterium]
GINKFLHISFVWTLQNILGYVFYPIAVILGVPLQDAGTVARIVGERTIVTEVVAYQDLAAVLSKGLLRDPRSAVITVYALCGFAHFASMAIFVGAVSALAPKRTRDISAIAFRALAAATLACLMTACVAGVFFNANGTILLGK